MKEATNKIRRARDDPYEKKWAEDRLEELLAGMLSEEQKEELAQATKRTEEAKGIIEYNKAQRALRTTRAELGLQREEMDPFEKWEENRSAK